MSDKAIDISYGFSVNDGDGKQVVCIDDGDDGKISSISSAGPVSFGPVGAVNSGKGIHDFALRSELISALIDGTLVIEVRMKLSIPPKSVPAPYIPENPVAKMIQGIFLDVKYSDIVFEVGGGNGKDNAMKVAKTTPVAFPAHRCIVENCSSIFAALCVLGEGDNEKIPIQINDVKPDMFRLLLNYMYGGRLSDDDMKSHAREIIDAADKYGVVNLKLEAEVCFVEGTTFSIENVMEHLSYAESKNCALLKEAVMDFIVDNKSDVIKKMSFAHVPGTLARDILVATSRREVRGPVIQLSCILIDNITSTLEPRSACLIGNVIQCASVNYAKGRTRKVFLLTGREKCSLRLSKQSRKWNQKRNQKRGLENQMRVLANQMRISELGREKFVIHFVH